MLCFGGRVLAERPEVSSGTALLPCPLQDWLKGRPGGVRTPLTKDAIEAMVMQSNIPKDDHVPVEPAPAPRTPSKAESDSEEEEDMEVAAAAAARLAQPLPSQKGRGKNKGKEQSNKRAAQGLGGGAGGGRGRGVWGSPKRRRQNGSSPKGPSMIIAGDRPDTKEESVCSDGASQISGLAVSQAGLSVKSVAAASTRTLTASEKEKLVAQAQRYREMLVVKDFLCGKGNGNHINIGNRIVTALDKQKIGAAEGVQLAAKINLVELAGKLSPSTIALLPWQEYERASAAVRTEVAGSELSGQVQTGILSKVVLNSSLIDAKSLDKCIDQLLPLGAPCETSGASVQESPLAH